MARDVGILDHWNDAITFSPQKIPHFLSVSPIFCGIDLLAYCLMSFIIKV